MVRIIIDKKTEKQIEDSGKFPCYGFLLMNGFIKKEKFKKDPNDKYNGNIFGNNLDLEDYHMFYRRFHKNAMKSLSMIYLKQYQLTKKEGTFLDEIEEIIYANNYDLRIVACHNCVVLLISAMEIFFKDNFKMILNKFYPEKIKESVKKTMRGYNFQNLESIEKAFLWLIPEFKNEIKNIYRGQKEYYKELDKNIKNIPSSLVDKDRIKEIKYNLRHSKDLKTKILEILNFRHKIVHESYYDSKLNSKEVYDMSFYILHLIDNFDFFFDNCGFYKKEIETISPFHS